MITRNVNKLSKSGDSSLWLAEKDDWAGKQEIEEHLDSLFRMAAARMMDSSAMKMTAD